MANNGTVTLSFEYNGDGLRTSKTVNGVKHTYRLNGSQIVSEAWGNHLLIYLYDAKGAPVGMMYRNSTYPSDTFDTFWFEKNLQGDIVAVYDEDGTKLISYTYDAWGNFTTTYHNDCTASDHANLNPFRYRGYYYDSELGMYYLQSRYYDPSIGRFINADGYLSTGQGFLGYNMFAYCNNNPQTYCDPCGTCIHFWFLLGLLDCDKCKSGPAFIDDFKNADGSYSVYDNKRDDPDRVFHEQVLAVNASGASLSPKDGELTLGALDVTVMTGGWEFEHFDLSLLDLGKAEASAGLTDSQFSLSAMASIWAPSVTWTIWGVDISLSAHVGSVGAALELGSDGVEIGAASGWGIGLSISWD